MSDPRSCHRRILGILANGLLELKCLLTDDVQRICGSCERGEPAAHESQEREVEPSNLNFVVYSDVPSLLYALISYHSRYALCPGLLDAATWSGVLLMKKARLEGI